MISGRPSRVRWRGRPTASDELLGRDRPGTPGEVGLRSARSWRSGSHSLRPSPSAALMKAPIARPSFARLATKRHYFGRRNGRASCSRRTGYFPPSQPFVIGASVSSPDFAHLARGATDAGGLRRYKACAGRTCSRAARPGRRDRTRALRVTFRRPCCGQPGRRCSRASPGIRPLSGRPSGSSPRCVSKQGFFSSGRTAISAGAAVRASSQNLTGYPSRCSAIESGCRGAGQRGIP